MLPARDVRGELVLVPAREAAHITLQWVPETMATHVYGVHDVVPEVDVTGGAAVHGGQLALTGPRGHRADADPRLHFHLDPR